MCGSGRGAAAREMRHRPRVQRGTIGAVTAVPGAILSGSNDGALRGYSVSRWHRRCGSSHQSDFKTVNGVPARGASMLGQGPAVAGGMLYVILDTARSAARRYVLLAFGGIRPQKALSERRARA